MKKEKSVNHMNQQIKPLVSMIIIFTAIIILISFIVGYRIGFEHGLEFVKPYLRITASNFQQLPSILIS